MFLSVWINVFSIFENFSSGFDKFDYGYEKWRIKPMKYILLNVISLFLIFFDKTFVLSILTIKYLIKKKLLRN